MIAAGIDLGGTKSEIRLFDANWRVVHERRDPTPGTYDALVATLAGQIAWAHAQAPGLPIGIGAAGLIDANGIATTANLPATGKPFPADIEAAASHPVTYVNDCRALALSEAVFGAGRGQSRVMSLILGTGVGGGLAIDGKLLPGPSLTGGEYGHAAAAAAVVARHNLPVPTCGCGRQGCYETYIAGPALGRLATRRLGLPTTPQDLGQLKTTDREARAVWSIWCEMTAELLLTMTYTADPDCIVLGGGLSQIPGVAEDVTRAAKTAQLPGFDLPLIALAEGGPTSGARGAAYAAWQARHG